MSEGMFEHQVIRASAGSGKTHQLTTRYLGLLAQGTEPDSILATTFTRKAAGEILERVLERLARAAGDAAGSATLAKEIGHGSFGPDDATNLLRALLRGLHRVRISTLDSFYIALASSFSLELGLPPGWSICEEADDAILQREALERLLDQQPEKIATLYPLLSKGESKGLVQAELKKVIKNHYETFRGSERAAWERLQVPPPVAPAQLASALERLRLFDLSRCGHKGFATGRDSDIAKFERQDWLAFIDGGLAGKVLDGETTYYKKPIPPQAQVLYATLLQHARSEILRMVADQTKATWQLLDGFHRELWQLKQATGALRFGEATQALVDRLQVKALEDQALAFRLDGAVEHLLLDEFQDTSLAQWRVLLPIAKAVTQTVAEPSRSFFCVGDVKQAIYGWRGGMAEIFDTLSGSLGQLKQSPLIESRRSAQPVIDVVNKVFGNFAQFQPDEKYQAGLTAWGKRFERHTTFKKEVPGYVCLHAGPAQGEDDSLNEHRGEHCAFVASRIKALVEKVPGRTVGVLCRKNETVARLIFELRQRQVDASEEGGNPLTDSPAVELILSLCTLADHPGHGIAWFHLQNSPLQEQLRPFGSPHAFAQRLRRELLADGYGKFVHGWAERVAAACNYRDLSRLQQLVEMAYEFEARSTLRADDFVAWVRHKRVPDPSSANVRVMTIHAAKGGQFDVVVLPELDAGLKSQTPAFVVGRDPATLQVDFVCRYADDAVQKLLTDTERAAFARDRQGDVEESLSLLYVAVTRAVYALHLYVPGPRRRKENDAWYNLLLTTLAPAKEPAAGTLLFEHGDSQWFQRLQPPTAPAAVLAPERLAISFRQETTERRRGMDRVAPSQRDGEARVPLNRLFTPSEGTGTAAGMLYHMWFSTIAWLDDGVPTQEALRSTAQKLRADLPAETWRDLERLLAEFSGWLRNPAVSGILRRSAYASPQQPGFPAALAPLWSKALQPEQVERERPFLIRDGTKFWNGSFDRVVWLSDGERTLAADVIDFKTDAIATGDAAALAARTAHYRPQLQAYRRAAARLAGLPPERVAARILFTVAGRVMEI